MLTLTDRRTFLERFFSGENRFQWTAITAGDPAVREIYVWAERLLQDPPLPTILPYAAPQGTVWYAIAPNDLALRRLAEDLMAFAGPTWSSLRGAPGPLRPKTAIDQAVMEVSGGLAFKFEGAQAHAGELGLKGALSRMRRVWSREKRSELALSDSGDVLLRRFAMAIVAQNRKEAEQALEALRLHQHLDVQNLLFLQVRMLHEFGRSRELLSLGGWDDLMRNRRPLAVTEAMAAAVYAVYLQAYETQDDPVGALAAYQETIKPRFETLGAYRGNSRQPALLKLRMFHALSEPAGPRPELLATLLHQASDPETRAYLTRLQASVPAAPAPATMANAPVADPVFAARAALDDFDFDRAFELAGALPPSERKVQLLAACAEEFGTLESEQALLKAFEELDGPGQDRILSSRKLRKQLEALTEAPKDQAAPRPEDWLGWVLAVVANPTWKQALDAASRGVREWPLDALAETPSQVAELVALLRKSHAPEAQRLLMNGLPNLIQAVMQDPQLPRSTFADLYAALRDLLVIEGTRNRSEAELFASLSQASLSLGLSDKDYEELLGYACEIWNSIASPAAVSWLLAFLELLVLYPCPNHGARQALLTNLVPELRGHASRMDRLQHQALAALARDCNLEALLEGWPCLEEEAQEAQLDWSVLRGKKLFMYSLQIRMVQRVGEALRRLEPGLKLTTSEEKYGSPTLRSQLRDADIVLVHTWHAKHAAGDFIEDHKSPHAAYLRPEGSGSDSIMRTMESYCRSLQE